MVEKLVPDPLFKKMKMEYISGYTIQSFIRFVFIPCPSRGRVLLKYIETKVQTTCFYLKQNLKNMKRSGTSLHASFSAWFLKKNISQVKMFCCIYL